MSRHKFFWIAGAIIFIYTWIPQWFASVFVTVSLLCVFGRASSIRDTVVGRTMRALGNADSGLGVGLGSFTLDWAFVGTAPITTPFVYTLNRLFGLLVYSWILAPVIFYLNIFGTPVLTLPNSIFRYLTVSLVPTFSDGSPYPNINTNELFDGNGTRISAVTLFDSANSYQLNETAYKEMKPILLGPMFTLSYLAQFLTLSSLFTSVLIWNGSTIWFCKRLIKQEAG
jgi:hypothetical protein